MLLWLYTLLLCAAIASGIDTSKYFYVVASTQKARAANATDLADATPVSILMDIDQMFHGYQPAIAGNAFGYDSSHSRFLLQQNLLSSPDCPEKPGPQPPVYLQCNSTGAYRNRPLNFYNGYNGVQTPTPDQRRWSLKQGYLLAWAGLTHGFTTVNLFQPGANEGEGVWWRGTEGNEASCESNYGAEECDKKRVWLHAYSTPFGT